MGSTTATAGCGLLLALGLVGDLGELGLCWSGQWLIFSGPNGGHVWRTSLNEDHWKPALAKVGVIPQAKSREHAAAREHGMHALRHFYASVLLDAGESIKALAEYLGHSDPGLTLKVYAHLMPSSRERARKALGQALRPQGSED